jgi:cyclic pyranopterin monophosphate synthase
MSLTHVDENGNARMVDVSQKDYTLREAVAVGRVYMKPATLRMIMEGNLPKGDVFSTTRIAGIMAAKRTSELIPMCHNIPLDAVALDLLANEEQSCVDIKVTARCSWKTGVEMEALTAVSIAGLTVYDMCKAVDKEMLIGDIALIKKTGGKSGEYVKNGY